ncbi:hypothetical protein HDU98_006264 [Podochytrium sp. JEL0797]|nr:hypothetical protein HDU98_006264 [Podochytrium sp. JEL0797]
MDSTLLVLLQGIQSHLIEISAKQSAFEVQQSESTARLEARLDRIESSLNESQPNIFPLSRTTLSATEFHLTNMESSIGSSLATMSNQLHILQNPQRKFYTRLTGIPRELLIQILAWISPTQVFRFRRVSAGFNALLTTKHFAVANIQCFPPSPDCYRIPANGENADQDCHDASEIEQVFFQAPTAFQTMYAETRLKTTTVLHWYLGDAYPCFLIPIAIGCCGNLTHMNLSKCRLSGPIPVQIGLLAYLKYLNLYCNHLSGEVPVELGGLAALETLNLCDNRLSGKIPPKLGGLSHLKVLNLSANRLTGGIPAEVGSLVQLEELILDENKLSGSIPISIGNLSRLVHLSLYGNRLSGPIPREVLLLEQLVDCLLFGNDELSCDFEWGFWGQ